MKYLNKFNENVNESTEQLEIESEIEDMSSEWAWVYRQEGESDEKFNITKESFIEGANYVLELLRDKKQI